MLIYLYMFHIERQATSCILTCYFFFAWIEFFLDMNSRICINVYFVPWAIVSCRSLLLCSHRYALFINFFDFNRTSTADKILIQVSILLESYRMASGHGVYSLRSSIRVKYATTNMDALLEFNRVELWSHNLYAYFSPLEQDCSWFWLT